MVIDQEDEKTVLFTIWREMEVRSNKQEIRQTKQNNTRIQQEAQQTELNFTEMEQEDKRTKQGDTRIELYATMSELHNTRTEQEDT